MPRVRLGFPVAALVAFAALLALVATGWAPLVHLDTVLSARAQAFGTAHPGWIRAVRVLTDVGATPVFLAAGTALTAVLTIQRGYARAVAAGLVTVTVPVCWALGHRLLPRPRPASGFVTALGNGFPSGHTANVSALALLGVLLLWSRCGRAGRVLLVAVAAAVVVFVALSRVALVAHWPSDVLGGALLALGITPLCLYAARCPAPGAG